MCVDAVYFYSNVSQPIKNFGLAGSSDGLLQKGPTRLALVREPVRSIIKSKQPEPF